jgi:formate hydrogenlyase subunit 3/multisubunit Na+/H+ antiporter MnhD subunit
MRRIDIILIGLGIFLGGGLLYLIFKLLGINEINAGIWTQFLLVMGIIIWTLSYLGRVLTQKMTYNQQLKDYEEAVMRKRLEEMTPEEIAKLQAELTEEDQINQI